MLLLENLCQLEEDLLRADQERQLPNDEAWGGQDRGAVGYAGLPLRGGEGAQGEEVKAGTERSNINFAGPCDH